MASNKNVDQAKLDLVADNIEDIITAAVMTPRVNPLFGSDPKHPSTQWGLPLNIVGNFATAKTSIIEQIAYFLQLPAGWCSVATKEPVHFYGVPGPGVDGRPSIQPMLVSLVELCSIGSGLFLFDEVSSSAENIQAAAMAVINEHRIGEMTIPSKVRMLCAMNPSEMAANGSAITGGLANRLCWIPYEGKSDDDWDAWCEGKPVVAKVRPAKELEAAIYGNWHIHFSHVNATRKAFKLSLNSGDRRSKMFNDQPEADDPDISGAWPTSRTWWMGICAISAARCLGMPKIVERALFDGCVGEGISTMFFEYMEKADLPQAGDILSKKWQLTNRLDINNAALSNVMSYIKMGHAKNFVQPNDVKAIWEVLADFYIMYPDLVQTPIAELVGLGLAHKYDKHPAAKQAARDLIKLVDEELLKG
jgi:hypothetical protein